MALDTTKPVNRSGVKSPPLLGFREVRRGGRDCQSKDEWRRGWEKNTNLPELFFPYKSMCWHQPIDKTCTMMLAQMTPQAAERYRHSTARRYVTSLEENVYASELFACGPAVARREFTAQLSTDRFLFGFPRIDLLICNHEQRWSKRREFHSGYLRGAGALRD